VRARFAKLARRVDLLYINIEFEPDTIWQPLFARLAQVAQVAH